jgi:hypothetical protein
MLRPARSAIHCAGSLCGVSDGTGGTFPDLSGRRLLREIRKLGYEGSYSTLKPFTGSAPASPYEV